MGAKRLKRAAAQPASVAMVASAEPQPRGHASTEVKQDGHRIGGLADDGGGGLRVLSRKTSTTPRASPRSTLVGFAAAP
jgi:hypothetical protein